MKIFKNTVFLIFFILMFSMSCSKDINDPENQKNEKKLKYGSFTDSRDGHVYKTITLGTQTWMAENLAYLPDVFAPRNSSGEFPRYYVYGYNGTDPLNAKLEENYKTFGVLYNWPAALIVCPEGWHLPSADEWDILENYLIDEGYGYNIDIEAIAKSMATKERWNYFSVEGTIGNESKNNNNSGFSAVPAGFYYPNEFCYLNDCCSWWTSTENEMEYGWFRGLSSNDSELGGSVYVKEAGFSVRCVKD